MKYVNILLATLIAFVLLIPTEGSSQVATPTSGSIGIMFQTDNQPPQRVFNLVIDSVIGPADKAGLKRGDIITSVDGRAVGSFSDLVKAIQVHSIGSTVMIGYLRNGQPFVVNIAVVDRDKLYAAPPPPGNAMALSIPQARAVLREAISRKYVGIIKSCIGALMFKGCSTWTLSAATDVHVGALGFELTSPFTIDTASGAGKLSVNFKYKQVYLQTSRLDLPSPDTPSKVKVTWEPKPLYKVVYITEPATALAYQVLEWRDEMTAQSFADAFNRLLYAVLQDEEFVAFKAEAKAWRENPAKPPLSAETDRQRLLAENDFNLRNLDSAVGHYERGVEIQQMWPAGWYNLAMIYGEQKNYTDAADRMRHYLELVPNAPDAKEARDQMIIWEDEGQKSR